MVRTQTSNKGKSRQRWQSGRDLEEVVASLKTTSQKVVIWHCWLWAEYSRNGSLIFDLTASQVARKSGLDAGHVKRVFRELTNAGVIETNKNGCNVGGRGLGSERRITFRKFNEGPASDES